MYWYGGTGNWSDYTNHWSNNSGNSPASPASNAPTSTDDAIFDTSSSASNAAYTVTIDAEANCANFTMDGPDPADAAKVTWAGSSALNIYGSMNLSGGTAGITNSFTGNLSFRSTSTGKTITLNSITLGSQVGFQGNGGGWTLQDNLNTSSNILFETANSTLDTNDKTVTCSTFDAENSTTGRVLDLGASTINCSSWKLSPSTNVSFTAGTSTIQCTGAFIGGGQTYYVYNNSNGNYPSIGDTGNTFTTITITGTASNDRTFTLSGDQTITGTLTINGNSAINRILVKSNTLGTARTLTAATVTITNADFQDITGAGAGSWDLSAITGGSGDCGGNTGITFTTADTWYWHADTGNVSDYTKWYTETNGGGSQMASTLVPLPQDTLRFDDSSFTAGSKTVTQNMPRIGSIDFTGATNTPQFTPSSNSYYFGSMTLISGMNIGGSTNIMYFSGRGEHTITCSTKSWDNSMYFDMVTGTYTFSDDFTNGSNRLVTLVSGTITADANVTIGRYTSNGSLAKTLNLGSGLWTLNNTGTITLFSNAGSNLTFNKGTASLKINITDTGTKTFTGGNLTFNDFQLSTSSTGILIIENSNTFSDFVLDAGTHIHFFNGTNTTVNTFTALGTSGSHITISNTSSTTHATLTKAGGGVISGCDYIDIQEMTGSPASTWYIGANSTDTGSTCTNIYLSDAPTTNIKTYNTNLAANIKTINTNVIANVKTLNTNA